MSGLIILLLEGLAVCLVSGVLYTIYALTHPPRRTYAHAVARARPGHPRELAPHADGTPRRFEEWAFRSRGVDLPVWDIAGDRPDGPVLVMTHGWGDSRIGAISRAAPLLPLCSRLVMWDLPGHGEAKGRCSMGTRETDDLGALLERFGATGRPMVLFGWSLGAGLSIAVAARNPAGIAGVITEAPYRLPQTPARNVLKIRGLPYRWNVTPAFWFIGVHVGIGPAWRGFDRAELARQVKCPLLVLHGALDAVSPPRDGREIADAGRGTFVGVPDAGHHGLWTQPESLRVCAEAVRKFLSEIGAPTSR